MENFESQLFVIVLVLSLIAIIYFVYKIVLTALGGPDKKEPKQKVKSVDKAPESTQLRSRPIIKRNEQEGSGDNGH